MTVANRKGNKRGLSPSPEKIETIAEIHTSPNARSARTTGGVHNNERVRETPTKRKN